MTRDELEINPSTTVHALLEAYPELEEKLIGMAPPFNKLRNPFLRNSIAKIATLKNIASVGNIPLKELIDKIRGEVNQQNAQEAYEDEDYFLLQPKWFSSEKITVTLVEDELEDKNKMTVVSVLREANRLEEGEIIELITTFLPAPGIDTMRSKGYSVWTTKAEGETIKTYFMK